MKEVIISLLDEVTAFLPDRLTASLSIRCKQACRRERGGCQQSKPSLKTLNSVASHQRS
jgi:hypothetical protein